MASTTAMFTGLSGLSSNSQRLDVIGNNIANVNTTAFKSNRIEFQSAFTRNFALGTSPGANTGGRNPMQIGLGTSLAGTQRNFANGTISPTGIMTDMAIEGDGFFVVNDGNSRFYTRAGSFQRNANNELVTMGGARVMGHPIDSEFNVVKTQMVDLSVPIGSLSLAVATRNVQFTGNLNSGGMAATTGSSHTSSAMFHGDDMNLMNGNEDLVNGTGNLIIEGGNSKQQLAIEAGANTVITISGIEKDGQDLGTFTFGFMDETTANTRGIENYGSTMNDFLDFLGKILGLSNEEFGGYDLGGSLSINANGEIAINGNLGAVQDLRIPTGAFSATSDTGNAMENPFVMSSQNKADGESVRTSFSTFDSLGAPVTVDLSFVLVDTTPGEGSKWMYIAESADHDAIGRIVGQGLVQFDSNGQYVTSTGNEITIARSNGAETPFSVDLGFSSGADAIYALADQNSKLSAVYQDGSPSGTLSNFAVSADGTIMGSFTNGLSRPIGQIALAKFTNPQGLVDEGNNLFSAGANSGDPQIVEAGDFGTGRIIGGALELSNVDLSQEFINMILASTGYSASSRVISTTNELIQQLLVLGR